MYSKMWWICMAFRNITWSDRFLSMHTLRKIPYASSTAKVMLAFSPNKFVGEFIFQFSVTIPKSFYAKVFSVRVNLSMCWFLRFFIPRCRTLSFPTLNFMRLLSAHFFSFSGTLWEAEQPPGVSALLPVLYHHQTCWGDTLPQHADCIKKDRTDPRLDLWDEALVIGLQLDPVWLIINLWVCLFSRFSVSDSMRLAHPGHNLRASLWRCYGRCWKHHWSQG